MSWVLAGLLALGLGVVASADTGTLTAHFIDVGQGDATLVVAPDGTAALIDGGSDGTVLAYLQKQGISRLALLVATTPEDDHVGGLIPILQTLTVDEVVTSGQSSSSSIYLAFANAVAASSARTVVVSRGEEIELGSVNLEVLNPAPAGSGGSSHGPIVLRLVCPSGPALSVGSSRGAFLFASDIDAATESDIVLSGLPLSAGVLKVADHGSCEASSSAFLSAVRPDLAIVSVGPNSDGDPCLAALSRLEAAGATVWRTDRDGTVVIQSPCSTAARAPNQAPTAAFTLSSLSPSAGEGVTADASTSFDPDGTIVSYSWTFSDGTIATGVTAEHSYASPGTYWICLTVADNVGAASTQCQSVTVPPEPDVRIECVMYGGTLPLDESDEYVQIRNYGTAPQNLFDWAVKNLSESARTYTFPSYVLQPGAAIRVYTNEVHPEWGGFTFGSAVEIWSDTASNTAVLLDDASREVDRCAYGLKGWGVCATCGTP